MQGKNNVSRFFKSNITFLPQRIFYLAIPLVYSFYSLQTLITSTSKWTGIKITNIYLTLQIGDFFLNLYKIKIHGGFPTSLLIFEQSSIIPCSSSENLGFMRAGTVYSALYPQNII